MSNGKFQIYKDKEGHWRFRLKARNGEIIAVGEGYTSKQNCLKGVKSIRKNARDARIVDMESGKTIDQELEDVKPVKEDDSLINENWVTY